MCMYFIQDINMRHIVNVYCYKLKNNRLIYYLVKILVIEKLYQCNNANIKSSPHFRFLNPHYTLLLKVT